MLFSFLLKTGKICLQHSLLYKENLAHTDGIWSCAWGRQKEKDNCEDTELEVVDTDDRASCSDYSVSKKMHDYIITGSVDYAKIWTFKDDSLELKHKLLHTWGVVSVSINSDGTKCATSTLEPSVVFWDIETGKKLKSIDLGINDIYKAAFTPDDKLIVFGSNTGCVCITDLMTEEEEEEDREELKIYPEGNVILSVAMSPNGKYIASGSKNGILEIFDVATGRIVHMIKDHGAPLQAVCFSTDSKFLLTASDSGQIQIYEIKNANVVRDLFGHDSRILNVAFSPDNQHFVSSGSDKTVRVWDIRAKQCLHTFTEHTDEVWAVTYNPEGNRILSVSDDNSINIYETLMNPENE